MHDLRILTLNCWSGRAEPAAIARLLTERSVDVACLQELAPRQATAVQEVLEFGKLEPTRGADGLGIALRFPGDVAPVPLPSRQGLVTTLHTDAWPQLPAALEIVNVHVQAPHARPWWALPLRRRQVGTLTEWLAGRPAPHRVLAGDLNSTPLWPAYRTLTRMFTDAATSVAHANGSWPRRTWGPTPISPRLLRIDHVLTAGAGALECEVVPIEGGDHSGVLATLRLMD